MSAGERIRVMIVDDHSIVRVGLKQVLEQSGEFEVVGQAADGEEAVRVAAEVSPDVVVMDVIMPGKDGVEACREIMGSAPETRVVMLTASTEEDAVVEAVAAGSTGYLQKETDREQLLSAVRDAVSGELRVPVEVVRRAFEEIRGGGRAEDAAALTQREREILVSVSKGMSYRPDSGGEGDQAGDRSERHLRHPAEVGCRVNSGVGALVRAERTAGRLAARTAFTGRFRSNAPPDGLRREGQPPTQAGCNGIGAGSGWQRRHPRRMAHLLLLDLRT